MIYNLYIEVNGYEELRQFNEFLAKFKHYNATAFDSCTSGPCKLDTLFDIECAIEGK